MRWMSDTTVRTRLISGFLIVAAIAAVIGALGIRSTQRMNDMAHRMYERELLGVASAAEANLHILAAGRALRSVLLAPDAEMHVAEYYAMESRFDSLQFELKKLEHMFDSGQAQKSVKNAVDAVAAYEKAAKSLVTQNRADLPSQEVLVDRLFNHVRSLADTAEIMVNVLTLEKQNVAQEYAKEIAGIYRSTLYSMIALTLGGAVLAILLGWLITRGLTRQLGGEPQDVARLANAIAKGDLTSRIDTRRAREGSVVSAMKRMQDSLRAIVAAVRNSSDHIATGSDQIAAGNADLSQRTEQQAANLTETAAAMEELSSTVKNNADVAQEAAGMAAQASASAVKGGEVVNGVVTTMNEINASSQKVVDIIGVIDTIAFQTNILALNAAVEAARAGEQGRGFAVVASEVRSLAQKSASAARDVKQLIDDSAQKVEAGSRMVDAAGAAMAEIVTQVKRVTDLISEISSATVEQTSGLNQINEAIAQLSDVTQQNAALVEESATAAESLRSQAHQLVEAVGVFNVGQPAEEEPSGSWAAQASSASASSASMQASASSSAPARATATAPLSVPASSPASASARSPAPARGLATAPAASAAEEWDEF